MVHRSINQFQALLQSRLFIGNRTSLKLRLPESMLPRLLSSFIILVHQLGIVIELQCNVGNMGGKFTLHIYALKTT